MNMIKNILIIVACATALTGCIPRYEHPKPEDLDYGKRPTTEACEKIAEARIKALLEDPFSAVFKHGYCGKVYLDPVRYGYAQSGLVNAKNEFGAYTGFRKYWVMIRHGRVVGQCISSKWGNCSAERFQLQ